jgi:hypothetical protein
MLEVAVYDSEPLRPDTRTVEFRFQCARLARSSSFTFSAHCGCSGPLWFDEMTQADETWLPLFDPATPVFNPPSLVTPPFPDHPSGHTCGTAAFMRTMHNFFGTDKIAFTATRNKSGTTRTFDRFSVALKEVIDARVWAGIHFRTADTQGAVLGNNVARHLKKHYFQPIK